MRRPPPIAIALGAGALAAAVLAAPIGHALGDLNGARTARDATALQITTPPSPVAESAIEAGSQAQASDRLATRLRALAQRGGVLVEQAAPVAATGAARVRLRVSGSQDGVIAFADGIERGAAPARFASWSLSGEGGAVRLSGEVVAPWR